jgi:hypothetical protein
VINSLCVSNASHKYWQYLSWGKYSLRYHLGQASFLFAYPIRISASTDEWLNHPQNGKPSVKLKAFQGKGFSNLIAPHDKFAIFSLIGKKNSQ